MGSAVGVGIDLHISVVDNHPKLLDKSIVPDHVIYIPNPSNTGFGAGCNLGIRKIAEDFDPDFFMLINPDAFVADDFFSVLKDFLDANSNVRVAISPLISFPEKFYSSSAKDLLVFNKKSIQIKDNLHLIRIFDSAGQAVMGSEVEIKTISEDDYVVFDDAVVDLQNIDKSSVWFKNYAYFNFGKLSEDYLIQNAGSFINENFDGGDLHTYWLRSRFPESVTPRAVWCGATVILPKSYLKAVGGFDEKYFLYYEDTDFALRGSKLGLHPLLNSKLNVFHHHSVSTGQNPEMRSKQIWISRSYFVAKNFGKFSAFMLFGARFLLYLNLLVKQKTTFRHFVKYMAPELFHSFIGLLKAFTRRRVGFFYEA